MAESPPAALSRRPYLLRALHEWMTDCAYTPHIIVLADAPDVQVPRAFVKDGKIVFNVSHAATQRLQLANDKVQFDARFGGVIHHVQFPISAVVGIYARETGEGMAFVEGDGTGPQPPGASEDGAGGTPAKRPQLTVVK